MDAMQIEGPKELVWTDPLHFWLRAKELDGCSSDGAQPVVQSSTTRALRDDNSFKPRPLRDTA